MIVNSSLLLRELHCPLILWLPQSPTRNNDTNGTGITELALNQGNGVQNAIDVVSTVLDTKSILR